MVNSTCFTLKNKGASQYHRIIFFFWFHIAFNISRSCLFHKRFFVAKEGSSNYKKYKKRLFFKKTLTEWLFVEPKMVLL